MDGLPFRSAPQVIETGYMEHDALGGRELKSYVNTRQSIYANVKDGLRVLQEKLDIVQQEQSQVCPISLGSTGLELSCSELMLISALWLYSDDRQADTLFLDLAERLANLDSLFPGRQFDNSGNLIEKLQAVNDSSEEVLIYSARALVVADSEGNRTGTFNGSKHFEIDNSLVDSVGEKIMVFFPESEYTYQITGQAAGEYSLVVSKHDSSGGQQIRALDIPMGTGQETHQYQIDWAALAAGDNAVYGNVDFDSDGSFDTGFESGPEISFASFVSSAYTCGDLDLSGGLGISDALVGLNTVTGAIVTRRQIELLGDINSDSKFTVIDVIHILQAIVGIAEQPPRC
jgi:hypothetical protein